MSGLTQFDAKGDAHMVDVSEKATTARTAVAAGPVTTQPRTFRMIIDHDTKKVDVLGVARIAGIMAAKKTHELIPLCHPLALTKVTIEFKPDEATSSFSISATVKTSGQTRVELEALTAVSVAGLTINDMVKAVDRGMEIAGIRLLSKAGGKSGEWHNEQAETAGGIGYEPV